MERTSLYCLLARGGTRQQAATTLENKNALRLATALTKLQQEHEATCDHREQMATFASEDRLALHELAAKSLATFSPEVLRKALAAWRRWT